MAKDKLRHIIFLQAVCEHDSPPVWEVPWAQAGCCWLRPTYVILEGVGGHVTGVWRMGTAQKKRAKACCNQGSLEQGELAGTGQIHTQGS